MKIKLSPWVLKLAYNLIDVESLGESSVFEQRTLEYGYAISKLCNLTPSKLLDVGCTARINPIPSTFCELGWRVVGLDIRDYTYTNENFTLIKDSILTNTLTLNNYDAITCISTLEHLGLKRYGGKEVKEADRRAIESISKLLRTNGSLILTVPYTERSIGYTTKLEKVYGRTDLFFIENYLKLTDEKILPGLFLSTWTKK